MKGIWHGHAVLEFITESGKKILVDPFITGNPTTDLAVADCHPDYILLTHAHADHVGDTIKIAQQSQAVVIAIVELASYLQQQGLKTIGINYGGSVATDFGSFKMVPAWHTSALPQSDGSALPLGAAAGFELHLDHKVVYVAGDTCLFSDMKLINYGHGVDLACLPIGGHFTMGPQDALLAAEFVKAKQVLPTHFNTFPQIKQDVHAFLQQLPANSGLDVKAGETFEF
ncbi:MAG: metal-dependent hydrolase [Liquorilactobacillus ghanensis]|uniref:metal-dependent hydrolase n=1 Tax=Liquorilactobacillus ghanensis TaxID=399370 RepID=UPI0039E9775E